MVRWLRVASITELEDPGAREIVCEGRIVALFRLGDQVFAMDGICPHQGGPLGQGIVRGRVVTCPWHGWQFDVATGQNQANASIRHPTYDVRLDDQEVFIDLDSVSWDDQER